MCRSLPPTLFFLFLGLICSREMALAQDTLTGSFEGRVTNSQTGDPVAGALAEIINTETGIIITKRTDSRGRFYQGLLPPGIYRIRVSFQGYQTKETFQRLKIAKTGEVVPVPVSLDPVPAAPPVPPTPPPPVPTTPPTPVTPQPRSVASRQAATTEVRASINTLDARHQQSFNEDEVTTLPLGALTLSRTFDQLALLAASVAPPPQTLGSVAGPGQGAGVGTAGQFSVNGLRSRANNFTVDGSDNNDEDIGVRRQGFVALIPQPIESIKEYQIITLLAPAQFGRNLGAQVNAVSKSGGSETHGTLYGFFNSSQLNARNFFDTANGTATTPLRSSKNQRVVHCTAAQLDPSTCPDITVRNQSGGEDSFTLGKFGATLGGPLPRFGEGGLRLYRKLFYFLSAEGQIINATQEESFAVPTVEQRGAFNSGATGIFQDPFTGERARSSPASRNGSAIFNLFPFPNNPSGVYGANTLTHELPAHARGHVLSAKLDYKFKVAERQQSLTGRYNYTNDRRTIPTTGEALFSTLQPRVRTQNLSIFLNSDLREPNSARPAFNQVRLSYGRTRLAFREVRDREFLVHSQDFPQIPFLLNAPLRHNVTLPPNSGQPNTGPVVYRDSIYAQTIEEELGTIGQVIVAGFNALGVDVFNFPQKRVNNTYQAADQVNLHTGNHNLIFGTDVRRTELNSDLPRNARPLVTFQGGPRLIVDSMGQFRPPLTRAASQVFTPTDLAAIGAPNAFYLTLARNQSDANINLRFHQFNFFGQDDWRLGRTLTLAYGLRYEYNTPPRETHGLIEKTFDDPALNLAPGLRQFIDGRTRIFEPDRNNFAPRIGLAYAPNLFGRDRATVIRGGYGLFYDQILGAVVSQSRNVFPSFLTLNFSGLDASSEDNILTFFNPANTIFRTSEGRRFRLAVPGRTVYQLDPNIPLREVIGVLEDAFPSALGATLPARRLKTPLAHHYTLAVEQQLAHDLTVSAAYVGTLGHHLLRFTTPNLGPGATIVPRSFKAFDDPELIVPTLSGRICPPSPATQGLCLGRPVGGLGTINLFESTASSRYDSLQLQVGGRVHQAIQFQANYTFSSAIDDVSDVFDLAGAAALPQNSRTFAGERAAAGFDVRHRLNFNFVWELGALSADGLVKRLLEGWQIAGAGHFRTGQPFTVNSIFDINLDGNMTDRLDTTDGLIVTGDRRQPLQLATDDTFLLLAPFGQDGRIGRNKFRAGNVLELDLAVSRVFALTAEQQLWLRAEFFNLINRANFGIPVRWLEAPGFGRAVRTLTPGRRIQFALKYNF
jgi:hypothetical protein